MKRIFVTLIGAVAFFVSTAQTNDKPYPFKSAYVEYELTGNTTGKQTLYIDEWGWNRSETTHSATKMLGQKTETHERKITKKLDTWQWVPGEKTGSKVHNQMLEELLADPNFNMKKFSEETMKSLGFEKTGTEVVNGKTCDIYKGMLGATSWIWNNIAVKTEVKLLGTKQVMTATKIEIDASVPGSEFNIPADIKFTETVFSPGDMMLEGSNEDMDDTPAKNGNKPEIKSLKDLKGLLKK
ncbi:MAG: hypothetical protein EOM73_06485 [Bacteroidia bacterium]|nr:hypothetical protein [Bacteroidia bacterium]